MKLRKKTRCELGIFRTGREKSIPLYTYPEKGECSMIRLRAAHVRGGPLRLYAEAGMRREMLLLGGSLVVDEGDGPRFVHDRVTCADGAYLDAFGLAYELELESRADCGTALAILEPEDGQTVCQTVDGLTVKLVYGLRGVTRLIGPGGASVTLEPGDLALLYPERTDETVALMGVDCRCAVVDLTAPEENEAVAVG